MLLTVFASVSLLTLSAILIYKNSPSTPAAESPSPATVNSPIAGGVAAEAKAQGSKKMDTIAQVNPSEGSRLNLVGHRLLKEGRYDDAINVLRRAVRSFPENSQDPSYIFAMYNLGHSLRRTGKVNEAIPLLMQCVQMDARNPMFHEELQAARRAVRNPS
jgi:tetratricopeptide (TPR) repeat protein